jgi:hypothetical protein
VPVHVGLQVVREAGADLDPHPPGVPELADEVYWVGAAVKGEGQITPG